jgi:hypothetical protein
VIRAGSHFANREFLRWRRGIVLHDGVQSIESGFPNPGLTEYVAMTDVNLVGSPLVLRVLRLPWIIGERAT